MKVLTDLCPKRVSDTITDVKGNFTNENLSHYDTYTRYQVNVGSTPVSS